MGDSFFVCHHLAALYAYGYVLVSLLFVLQPGGTRLQQLLLILDDSQMFVCSADAWCSSLLCQLPAHFRVINAVCEPKVKQH